jgi:hypoxanthine-DNA glycosylase
LLAQGVGVWDVYAQCEREGSLDSAIGAAQLNDFPTLLQRCPRLSGIAHNGGESFRHATAVKKSLAQAGLAEQVTLHRLPSTSPAHASWTFEQKRTVWAAVMQTHRLWSGDALRRTP